MFEMFLAGIKMLGGASAIASKGMDIWAQKNNIDLQKFQGQTSAKQAVIVASVHADEVKTTAYASIMLQAMNHKVFWIAWALFVIPGGLHHAAVYAVSIFGISPKTFSVLAVPDEMREVTKQAVMFILGSQVITGSVSALSSMVSDVFGKQRS